jgi:hypothetical protein
MAPAVENWGSACFAYYQGKTPDLIHPYRPSLVVYLQIQLYNNHLSGVGYKGRFQWATYSFEKKQFSHGEQGGATNARPLANGEGFVYTPYAQPGSVTKAYCIRLKRWWEEVSKQRKELIGENHEVDISYTPQQVVRKHSLIQNISPDMQPSGYFNCTVEVVFEFFTNSEAYLQIKVVHGHMNDSGPYSLYVTDYSQNDQLVPIQASWCLPSMGCRVLKIEVWDDASPLAQAMVVGEYWSIRNVRARISHGGYLEGKLAETKFNKLEIDDAHRNPHLKELLEYIA